MPRPNALGVLGISEIALVLGLLEPGLLADSLACLLTLGLGTEALPPPVPGIRQKKFLAVEAIAVAFLRFHRFPHRGNQGGKNRRCRPRKSNKEEESKQRRRNKKIQRIWRRKINRRTTISRTPLSRHFHSAGGTEGRPQSPNPLTSAISRTILPNNKRPLFSRKVTLPTSPTQDAAASFECCFGRPLGAPSVPACSIGPRNFGKARIWFSTESLIRLAQLPGVTTLCR